MAFRVLLPDEVVKLGRKAVVEVACGLILTQPVMIVGLLRHSSRYGCEGRTILAPVDEAKDALLEPLQNGMLGVLRIARVSKKPGGFSQPGQFFSPLAHGEQPCIGGDRPAPQYPRQVAYADRN